MSAETKEDLGALEINPPPELNQPKIMIPALSGETISTGVILEDPQNGGIGLFFVFPSLSCPVDGEYRLRCAVIDMKELL